MHSGDATWLVAQDGFLTSHVIQSVRLPEPEMIREYLGAPDDEIECPTPAQRLVFGDRRRRIPVGFDADYPAMLGVVQNQDAYAQGVAAQRPFWFDHVADLTDRAMAEFAALTGRRYARATGRLDALVGSVLRESQLADAVGEHRGIRGGQVELAGVDLGNVRQQLRGDGAIAGNQGGETLQQGRVRQVRQRVGAHRRDSAGAGYGGGSSSPTS